MKTVVQDEKIAELGPWFHNLHLPGGAQTAPDHPIGDFPTWIWETIAPHLPEDLSGWTALDIGCNAGFYSFELARRGAEVTAIDMDPHYLRQARWAAKAFGLADRVRFQQRQVYDLAGDASGYDLVWFMGVLYHLRYPLLGLDIVSRLTRRMIVFQSMTAPGEGIVIPPDDFSLAERQQMNAPGWPRMAFIEKRLANDPTNWWAPNNACLEAMLRSSGLKVTRHVPPETYFCEPQSGPRADGMEELLELEFAAATGMSKIDPLREVE